MTESAEHGASVAAMVGTTTTGTSTAAATALAVSKIFPPPTPSTTSEPVPLRTSTRRSISAWEHSPQNSSKAHSTPAATRLASTRSPKRFFPPAEMITRAFLP